MLAPQAVDRLVRSTPRKAYNQGRPSPGPFSLILPPMDFAIGLLLNLLFPAKPPAVAPAQPAVLVTAVQGEEARKLALAAPAAVLETARANRAAVKHERVPQEAGTLHRFTFPDGAVVEFSDRPKRPRDQARRERVVAYVGTERAQKEPDSTFEAAGRAAGLTPEAIQALRFVSRHEGGFDAINTWDRARFSWGFIQFAGGYGFPPALAHFKASSPELFRKLMGDYGIDVLPGDNGRPQPVLLDCETGRTLEGNDAEQAYGDDPLNIALFIRAGRVTEVKQRQVEAAIRDYASPALAASFEDVRYVDFLRSPQSLAMLIDRQVHEGNVSRFEWALEHARSLYQRYNPAEWPALEGVVLDLAVQDAAARADIVVLAEEAATALDRAAMAARNGDAALVPAGPSLTGARVALDRALYQANYRMVTSYRRDDQVRGYTELLIATDPMRVQAMAPEQMASELQAAAARARELVSRFRFEYAIRDRLRNIRNSDLPRPPR